MFISMLHLTFPNISIDEATRIRIANQQPRFSSNNLPDDERQPPDRRLQEDSTLNELVQVHITEIRALVLQFLLRSVIRVYAPPQSSQRLEMFTSSLIRDEAAHIAYTAAIFQTAASNGRDDFLNAVFEARVKDFNDLTMVELERENKVAI